MALYLFFITWDMGITRMYQVKHLSSETPVRYVAHL